MGLIVLNRGYWRRQMDLAVADETGDALGN